MVVLVTCHGGRRASLRPLLVVLCGACTCSDALGRIEPVSRCPAKGAFFDAVALSCAACASIDARAVPGPAGGPACECAPGLVQCAGGERCFVRGNGSSEVSVVGEGEFQCFDCPRSRDGSGMPLVPVRDRTRCLPCHIGGSDDASSTLGFDADLGDCACPAGSALVERGEDGALLAAKRCVRCAAGLAPASVGNTARSGGCEPCPDPRRMRRNAETGRCECIKEENFVFAGGACVDVSDFDSVTERFPLAAAVELKFRDVVDGREDLWQYGFGHFLGIQRTGGDEVEKLLSLDEVATKTVSSALVKWLYVRCGVGCLSGNATACQCISNLCVLGLYDDQVTVCRFVRTSLYEGRPSLSEMGGVQGMPWLFYTARAPIILKDRSLKWRFTLAGDASDSPSDTTNALVFWLARYGLEGDWRGWERVDSELELCRTLGGGSSTPMGTSTAWRRFGGSLETRCQLPLNALLKCGQDPVFYELFVENTDGSLLAVPVRVLNLIEDLRRPNRNDREEDDVFVRRFFLCDSVSGLEGEGAYPTQQAAGSGVENVPVAFRWAAHLALEVRGDPERPASIFVPVLSVAYAEKVASTLQDGEATTVSFKSEYSMDTESYWTTVIVLFVLTILCALCLACFRMYLTERRYPFYPFVQSAVGGRDPSLFAPKAVIHLLALFSSVSSAFFWFYFVMAMYWLVTFKLQDAPLLLLPSALIGNQYEGSDIVLVLQLCLAIVTAGLALYKQLKVFVFFVDWEPGGSVSSAVPPAAAAPPPPPLPPPSGARGGVGAQLLGHSSGSAAGAVGGSAAAGAGGALPLLGSEYDGVPPDAGVSAWRSIFVCNELNERLTAMRTVSHVTWLGVALCLEGFGWKNVARWYPAVYGDDGVYAAQFNPFLQYAMGSLIWLSVVTAQLLFSRIASIWCGNDLKDFVDVCSVANVSVFFMDEPFHGYYIHGKAPSGRGDWCHTDLLKVIHDESQGIGFHRGLAPEGMQTFEFYMPQELDVPMSGGGTANFNLSLGRYVAAVLDLNAAVQSRAAAMGVRGTGMTAADVAERSRLRCGVQALLDAFVHAVMRSTKEVIRERTARERFLHLPPTGGISALTLPAFYEDREELAWSSCLAAGDGIRPFGLDIPTGFEWLLMQVEVLLFVLIWRFGGSVYFGAGASFLLNRAVLYVYRVVGRNTLAHTAVVERKFLI